MNVAPAIAATTDVPPRPLHNAALLTVASAVAKACGFAQLLVAARVLGKHGIGDYGLVMAFVGLFAVGTDLGLSTLAVRDVAQDRQLLPRYVSNVLVLRLLLAILTAAVCIITAFALGYSPVVRTAVVIAALALVPIAVTGAMGVVFQAIERLGAMSVLTAATAALTSAFGIAVLLLGGGVVGLIAAAAVANLVAALAALAIALQTIRIAEPGYGRRAAAQVGATCRSVLAAGRRLLDAAWWPALLRSALPFAVLTLLNVLYSRADAVLVFGIKGNGDAGLYTVAYRVVDTLLVVAISPFNAAALPAFNRVAVTSSQALARLVVAGIPIMIVAGAPVAAAMTVYARVALQIVGGRPEYLAAVPAVQWLAWSFPCFMVLAILYNALYAAHRARDVAVTFALALVCNITLNLLLIPRFSYFASAALTTATEALNVGLAGWALYRCLSRSVAQPGVAGGIESPGVAFRLLAVLAKTIAATALMILVMLLIRPAGPILGLCAGLAAGSMTYLLALRYLRTLGEPERAILANLPIAGRYARWL